MDQAEGTQNQNSAPNEVSKPVVQEAPQEKTLRQSEVDELVKRLKHEAYAKGKADAQASYQQPPQGGSMGGMPQVTDDHVRRLIAEEAQKQAHLQAAQGVLNNFVDQMDKAKGKYSDFDATIANLGDMKNIPHVVELAADTGIAGDVMYELGRNPGKVASLTTLAYINPQLARVEMKKLADSIKTNQQAENQPSANEPLNHPTPSAIGGKDNGVPQVRDFRKRYRI